MPTLKISILNENDFIIEKQSASIIYIIYSLDILFNPKPYPVSNFLATAVDPSTSAVT